MSYTPKRFLIEFRERNDAFISHHRDHKMPINYEIECPQYSHTGECHIRVSNCNTITLTVSRNILLAAMDEIASYTNNELGCGCTFTIGW